MRAKDRTAVLVEAPLLGRFGMLTARVADLGFTCHSAGLNTEELVHAALNPACRVLLLAAGDPRVPESSARLASLLRKVVGPAIDRGVMVVLVVDTPHALETDARSLVVEQMSHVMARADSDSVQLPDGSVTRHQPLVYGMQDLSKPSVLSDLVREIRLHWPGRSPGAARILPEGIELADHVKLMLRRSFDDAKAIQVEVLSASQRGMVLEIQPFHDGATPSLKYIGKLAPTVVIAREWDAADKACATTPFAYLPPISPDRFVAGREHGLLVSHHVDRAIGFDQFIARNSPTLAVASLFDGPLRCWHANVVRRNVAVVQDLLSFPGAVSSRCGAVLAGI